jgi:transposase-like protein
MVLLMRFAPVKPAEPPLNRPYNKFKVDPMPVIQVRETQDYRELLETRRQKTGRVIAPVRRRKKSNVPKTLFCPYCQAPHQYIYDNNGSQGQFQCKVCKSCFAGTRKYPKSITFRCPFYGRALEHKKERTDFNIHKCTNNACSFYLDNLAALSNTFDYEPTSQLCGDETYVKVSGKWHYLYFIVDAVKKNILAYPVSPTRDTQASIHAVDDALSKFKEIPDGLNMVFDGNPTYLLAQHFFAQHDIHFDMKQVIGLKNLDPVSKEYRPLKQIIERLNRTFKLNYRPTTGFGSKTGPVSFVTLFVAYFNFLRPHSSLEKRVPSLVPEFAKLPHMPAKWQKLLEPSQDRILKHQAAS